ncbi:MAG: hypothetical protein PQ964_03290 [Methanobacteriaceae archaeon]|jgi:hypothetical protein
MRRGIVIVVILLLLGGYIYIAGLNGRVEPLGRLGFVKLSDPDMYPGNPHSQLLARFAEERNSRTALVLHFGGSSRYAAYREGDTFIIQMAFVDTKGSAESYRYIQWMDVINVAIFGIPDGRYIYRVDGINFKSYDKAMAHVNRLARQHGQRGPIPMVWHGTARSGNPVIMQGCGFPLFFDIVRREFGIIPAFYYLIKGMIFPYFNLPYRNFQLQHASKLQYYYTQGMMSMNVNGGWTGD